MGMGNSIWDRIRIASAQRHWTGLADRAESLDPQTLEGLRGSARLLRRQADRLIRAANLRQSAPLAPPAMTAAVTAALAGADRGIRLPGAHRSGAGIHGIDWIWRPDLWRGAMAFGADGGLPGVAGAKSGLQICDFVSLFHDCPLGEITCHQRPNPRPARRDAGVDAPHGLGIEVFGFRGSFMSLAFDLPPPGVEGARRKHVIRLDMVIEAERPLPLLARLNVRHGPNVEQIPGQITGGVSGAASGGASPGPVRPCVAEFDLAYCEMDETRIEKMWIDLFLHAPQMNSITLRDLTICRHPRAAL